MLDVKGEKAKKISITGVMQNIGLVDARGRTSPIFEALVKTVSMALTIAGRRDLAQNRAIVEAYATKIACDIAEAKGVVSGDDREKLLALCSISVGPTAQRVMNKVSEVGVALTRAYERALREKRPAYIM